MCDGVPSEVGAVSQENWLSSMSRWVINAVYISGYDQLETWLIVSLRWYGFLEMLLVVRFAVLNRPLITLQSRGPTSATCSAYSKRLRYLARSASKRPKWDNIVEDRLKILVGLAKPEGHAWNAHTLQVGFTAQRSPGAYFFDEIVIGK